MEEDISGTGHTFPIEEGKGDVQVSARTGLSGELP